MLFTEFVCPVCGGVCRTQPGKGTVCPYCMNVLAQPDPHAAAVLGKQYQAKRRGWYGFIIGTLAVQTLLAFGMGGDFHDPEWAHSDTVKAFLIIWFLSVLFGPALIVDLRQDEWWVTDKPVHRLPLHIVLQIVMILTLFIGVFLYKMFEQFIG